MHDNAIMPNKRKRRNHRSWRERKERFGEMLQIDDSVHDKALCFDSVCYMESTRIIMNDWTVSYRVGGYR